MFLSSIAHARVVVLTATIILAPALIYVSPVFDPRPACERGASWATEHRDDLPRTAADLAGFPESVRRSIFSALPAETKAAMWREQLLAFKTSRRLTTDQKRLIDEATSHLTPILYSPEESLERYTSRNAFNRLAERARALFPPEEAQVFSQLSHSVVPKHTFASLRFRFTEELRRSGTALAFLPECNCSIWGADCGFGTCDEGERCSTVFGCGSGGTDFCTGRCV